ncbi:MAG: hypothetical protein Q7S95_03905 [bacterium]|nr:hypothetical protein [bacterium]
MSRHGVLILLGILILLTPFSGLPGVMRTLLAVTFGAIVLGIGIAERSRAQRALAPVAQPIGTGIPDTSESTRVISAI